MRAALRERLQRAVTWSKPTGRWPWRMGRSAGSMASPFRSRAPHSGGWDRVSVRLRLHPPRDQLRRAALGPPSRRRQREGPPGRDPGPRRLDPQRPDPLTEDQPQRLRPIPARVGRGRGRAFVRLPAPAGEPRPEGGVSTYRDPLRRSLFLSDLPVEVTARILAAFAADAALATLVSPPTMPRGPTGIRPVRHPAAGVTGPSGLCPATSTPTSAGRPASAARASAGTRPCASSQKASLPAVLSRHPPRHPRPTPPGIPGPAVSAPAGTGPCSKPATTEACPPRKSGG